MNVNWVSGSANATTVQREGDDEMTAVGLGVGVVDHVVVDVNPHLRSRSLSEVKETSPASGSGSGHVTPKREVTFLEREGGQKERGKRQGDEVNVVVPAASTSAHAPSVIQIPATRVEMKEVPASEDVVMPTTAPQALSKTAQPLPSTVTPTSPTAQVPSTQHATVLGELQQSVVDDPVLKVVRFPSAQ